MTTWCRGVTVEIVQINDLLVVQKNDSAGGAEE